MFKNFYLYIFLLYYSLLAILITLIPNIAMMTGFIIILNGAESIFSPYPNVMLTLSTKVSLSKSKQWTTESIIKTMFLGQDEDDYYLYHWFMNIAVINCMMKKWSQIIINTNQNDINKLTLSAAVPAGYKELQKRYLCGFYAMYILDNSFPKYTIAMIVEISKKEDEQSFNRLFLYYN